MNGTAGIPPARAALLILLASGAAYANSVGNDFAYDDNTIISGNAIVTEGRVRDALASPYWPDMTDGVGLYRPITSASYAAEWTLWGGSPAGFHAVNVAAHAAVSLLVFLVLLALSAPLPALVGGLLFALHPVHTEAVANVVGRAELYSAMFVMGACLVFTRADNSPLVRVGRLLAIGALFVLGLGSKEMSVTLPALLVLLAMLGRDEGTPIRRVLSDIPVFLLTGTLLVAFLVSRILVIGSVAGEAPAAYLAGLSTGERILTSLSVWPHYFRLLVFPLDLVADYGPAVLFPALSWGPDVMLGLLMIAGGVFAAVRMWKKEPLISLGLCWFAVTILPVTNLLFPTGILLAERTLYLPSVGFALVVAGVVRWTGRERPGSLRSMLVVLGVVGAAFMGRTVLRNPSWMSTYVMLSTLTEDHPESFFATRARARGLNEVGEVEEASRHYDVAVELVPGDYGLQVEVARFYGSHGRWQEAERLLTRAIEMSPNRPVPWQILSEHKLMQGLGREGHRIALQGLARVGTHRDLWTLVSESYVAKGDFEAAIRARWAAFAAGEPDAVAWRRMAQLMELAGRTDEAAQALEQARLSPGDDGEAAASSTTPQGSR